MSKRAQFMVMVAGTNITSTLAPVLISLTVSNKVGTHSDTATLEVDDTGGRIVLPQIGAPVIVALGWEGEGLRTVFSGTVDEVRSSGSRSGRTLNITAKGVDTTAKPKEPQQRHFDGKTVEDSGAGQRRELLGDGHEFAGRQARQGVEPLGSHGRCGGTDQSRPWNHGHAERRCRRHHRRLHGRDHPRWWNLLSSQLRTPPDNQPHLLGASATC